MSQANANPVPPSDPVWDITVTRLMRAARPHVDACALDLARRFQSIGLGCDTQVRCTPRGLSTFLAVVGQRGLICIVEMTLVDGMAVGRGPCTELDIRLLDACGEVVEDGLASSVLGNLHQESFDEEALRLGNLGLAVTVAYVATLAQFDLLRSVARYA
jgi:hypothetical protein